MMSPRWHDDTFRSLPLIVDALAAATTMCEWLECRVQEEKPSTPFTFAASVTVPEVKLIANLFPSRILCFLRFLLFQDETNNMHPLFAHPARSKPASNRRERRQRSVKTAPQAAARRRNVRSLNSRGTHSTATGITRFTSAIQDANFGKLLYCAPQVEAKRSRRVDALVDHQVSIWSRFHMAFTGQKFVERGCTRLHDLGGGSRIERAGAMRSPSIILHSVDTSPQVRQSGVGDLMRLYEIRRRKGKRPQRHSPVKRLWHLVADFEETLPGVNNVEIPLFNYSELFS
jgi:hypothetical protein